MDEPYYDIMSTPLGDLLIVAGAAGIMHVSFQAGDSPLAVEPAWRRDGVALAEAAAQLQAYFAGERRQFTLPLAPQGTPFQQAVWRRLQTIPYGHTTTYGALAEALGDAKAARAVGAANGRNPIPILIPCHRLVGHDGRLTGFRGGIGIKAALLALERHGN